MTKGMAGKGPPDPPKWVEDGFTAAQKGQR
jgi:hypothetical protein